MPSLIACCRNAPTVRFISFEIFATGVYAFECLRSSACIAFVHATVFFVFFSCFTICISIGACLLSQAIEPTPYSRDAAFRDDMI